jgi:amino acid permease
MFFTGELIMKQNSEILSLLKQPSAWIPLVMSLAALTMILVYVAIFSIVHHEDEGTPAHIFQLIMVAQLPIIAYFGFKWLPERPKQSLIILALQAIGWLVPIVTIIWFESR